MRNTSVEDSGYYYCELMVRGKEPIIEEVTKLTGTVPSGEMLQFSHVENALAISRGGNAGNEVRHSHP